MKLNFPHNSKALKEATIPELRKAIKIAVSEERYEQAAILQYEIERRIKPESNENLSHSPRK